MGAVKFAAAVAVVLSAVAGCGQEGSRPPVALAAPAELPPFPGIARVAYPDLLLGPPPGSVQPETTNVFEFCGALPIPDSRDAGVALIENRPMGRSLEVKGIRCESLPGGGFEVARDVEDKRYWMCSALGRVHGTGAAAARVLSVRARDKYDSQSLYYSFAPWPMTPGITLQSRVLAAHAGVECTRELRSVSALDFELFAVGDCDGDQDDDFLLLMRDENEVLLVSGATLTSLGTIHVPGLVGRAACELGDLDGDGVREVFTMFGGSARHQPPLPVESAASNDADSYCVLSPKKLALHSLGSLAQSRSTAGSIYAAGSAGESPEGHPRVALGLGGNPPNAAVLVFDVTTGETVDWVRCRHGTLPRHWKPVSGRIAGDAQRQWLAWSEERPEAFMRSPRLFVMEIGDDASVHEIALPGDHRAYGDSGCAVSVEGSDADALAISVAARDARDAASESAPILFLDVARCFVKH